MSLPHWLLLCSGFVCFPLVVSAEHPQSAAMRERVDELISARWQEPAVPASDAEFLRRVHLDLNGVVPTVARARSFLDDHGADKRERLVDVLLSSPRYSTHLATTWRNIMLPRGSGGENDPRAEGLQDWLRERFAENLRYDQLVADLMVASDGGPALFYAALQFKPEELAANTARIFMGVQLQCAQCHDHPFDRWTQQDFWGFAAFFARVQSRSPNAPNVMMAVALRDAGAGEVMLPGQSEPVAPRYLDGDRADESLASSRRALLSLWLASRDNPYLARAAVNWAWAHLFGRGLVDPVDDLGSHNPPSHPQLMQELTDYFIRTGFDLRELLRTLALTRAYGLSSESGDPAPSLFARMAIKPLTAEQFYDSLSRATLRKRVAAPMPQPPGLPGDLERAAFIAKMPAPTRSATDYVAGPPQALLLMNGPEVSAAVAPDASGLLSALEAPWFDDHERLDVLFLATLSRFPDHEERDVFAAHLAGCESDSQRQTALGDILWTLLNSAEFAMNH